jgi:histidinol dehydrogenase
LNFIFKAWVVGQFQAQKAAFEREAGDVIRLAEIEGLGAHANSVKIRLKRSRK